MKKSEAIALENLCDELLSNSIGVQANISMALSGKLKIKWDTNYFTYDLDNDEIDYINYYGCFNNFKNITNKSVNVIKRHIDKFELLFNTYNNRCALIAD